MSIIGVGGVGKTALVQNIFDHPGLDFKIKMWVCVSTSFEVKAIITNMLESLTKTNYKFDTIDAATRTLKEKIMGQNFLLVLDDVWNDKEKEKLKKVVAGLLYGGEGSKILLTTRMESVANTVAKVVGDTKVSLNMNGLEEPDYLLLFEKYAFADFNPNDHLRLQSIGKEIARKLRGIPLAVMTIGGMLNDKLEDEYWSEVLEDGALNSDKGTEGIMKAIKLSYEHLPPNLKPCFRYCSIFPQDYKFERKQLVDMWISVGLIPEGKKRQEEFANEIFETFVQRSFFETIVDKENIGEISYRMHDLLHELAQILSKNECLQVVSNDPIQIPQSIRHLSLRTSNILVLKNQSELKYLRTLLLFCDIEDAELEGVIDAALKGLKTIRYFHLSAKHLYGFPKSIGDLVHLRYLRITGTHILKLSPCICTLYHLQILEFTSAYCIHHSQLSIPADMCKLSKLKRLYLPLDAISIIPHIGKLRSLEQLIGYSVKDKVGYDICELEMMLELRELTITNLANVESTEKASKAQLNSKPHLRRIALNWGHGVVGVEAVISSRSKLRSLQHIVGYSVKGEVMGYHISDEEIMSEPRELTRTEETSNAQPKWPLMWPCNRGFENIEGRNESDKKVADCLQPHQNLKDLLLDGYRATTPPTWLKHKFLPNLTKVNLTHCSSLERLPPFGQLQFLKILILVDMGALKKIDFEFYGSTQSSNTFPALEALILDRLIQLEEWREDTLSEKWFPRLKRLAVLECPSLKKLPPIPTALKELELKLLDIDVLPGFKQKNEGSSTDESPLHLSFLHIKRCSKLTTLNSGIFMHPEQLSYLEVLAIWNCAELVHLPSEGFKELISLKSLTIEGCRRLFLLPMSLPKNFFPPSVQQVMLGNCGDITECLPELLLDLSLISLLNLKHCANLITLPLANVLKSLKSLKVLEIQNCQILESLGGLEAISSLKVLVISKCPMLAMKTQLDSVEQSLRNRLPMALDRLAIDHTELLLAVPLRNLHLTKSVEIGGSHSITLSTEQWLLQNGASLQSLVLGGSTMRSVKTLPDSIRSFLSLRYLALYDAYQLIRLPELPGSLEVLLIYGCTSELANRLKEGGLDYDKIRYLDLQVYRVLLSSFLL